MMADLVGSEGVQMARVKIEYIVDHLSSQFQNALEEAIDECVDEGGEFDPTDLFRAFKRAVGRKCSTWERVPDQYVEKV
jgi:hypothetical protein